MVFIRITETYGARLTLNMSHVVNHGSTGAGNTEFLLIGDRTVVAKESYEEIEKMLEIALTGYPGVVSTKTVEKVVR